MVYGGWRQRALRRSGRLRRQFRAHPELQPERRALRADGRRRAGHAVPHHLRLPRERHRRRGRGARRSPSRTSSAIPTPCATPAASGRRSSCTAGRGEDQTELTVFLRVGGYSAESAGEAWFDDVEIAAVDAAPDGVAVASFAPVSSDAGSDEADPRRRRPLRRRSATRRCTCCWRASTCWSCSPPRAKCRRAPEREPTTMRTA